MIGFLCLVLAAPQASAPPKGWVKIPAGKYQVGGKQNANNPLRIVRLQGFEISKTELTNAEFAKFIEATGYVTDAERNHNAMVFEPPLKEFRWILDPTAYWRYPFGKSRGGIEDKMDHPVTCISFYDGLQYCKWANVRLPKSEEWEVACRAGSKTDYFFGSNKNLIREYANVWHLPNHLQNDKTDGWVTTSPVGSFKPNAFGMYDTYGNVFEFVDTHLPTDRRKDLGHSRGGSWWCSKTSCCFFNSVDIGDVNPRASFANQGFRVARSSPSPTK